MQAPCNHQEMVAQDTHAEDPGYEKNPSWQLVQTALPGADMVPLGHMTNVLEPPGQEKPAAQSVQVTLSGIW